jgi:tetratricopeptide (TPR) repeat protein
MKKQHKLLLFGLGTVIIYLNIISMELPPDSSVDKNNNFHDLILGMSQKLGLGKQYQQASRLLENKEYLKALECFKEVYENSSQFPEIHLDSANQLGHLYFNGICIEKDSQKAMEYFKAAYNTSKNLEDKNQSIYQRGGAASNIGMILFKSGNKDLARKHFNKSYTLAKMSGAANEFRKKSAEMAAFAANYLGNIALYKDKNTKKPVNISENLTTLRIPSSAQ